MIGVPLFFYIIKRTSDFLLEKLKQLNFAPAITFLVYVVGGFISCSLIPAIVFHHIEGWSFLQAWYFTLQTMVLYNENFYPSGKKSMLAMTILVIC